MRLTERQEKLVSAYLRQSNRGIQATSHEDRAQALSRVKAQLKRELTEFGAEALRDEDVMTAIERCREVGLPQGPARPEAKSLPRRDAKGKPATTSARNRPVPVASQEKKLASPLASEDRVWLGVCLQFSERYGLSLTLLRTVFVLIGLITGPVALILYLGLYFEVYIFEGYDDAPEIDSPKLLNLVFGTLAGTLALYCGAWAIDWGVAELFERFFGNALALGQWGWISQSRHTAVLWVLAFVLPVATLAGLPLHNGWDYTAKKIAQATLAVYAVFLCFGVAMVVVGTIFLVVNEYVG